MIVTFQAQLDPLDNRTYTPEELETLNGELNVFCSKIEKFGYLRCQMYVDGKVKE